MAPVDLVQRGSFSSQDEAEVTEFIRQTYADNTSRFAPIRNGARFAARTHDTPVLGSDRLRTTIDYSGTTEQGFTDLVFFVVHAGTVRVTSADHDVLVAPGDTAVYPLRVPISFAMHGFDVTTVRLSADRVRQVAAETTGIAPDRLAFHALTPASPPLHRYWRSLVGVVGGALSDPASPLGSPLLAEDLARTVATAALHVFPNSTMTRQHVPGPGAVAPATVRRAAAHIEEHAHLPLSLAEIADAAGTSPRALQYGFRRHLGTTPLGHLRRVRLHRAHRELQAADPRAGDGVAVVAARWGFSNPGRFAAAYRDEFGVPPSRTLRG